MNREMCYRCFWPKSLCWCPSISPIETRTKIIILMHPKEYKREKAATGRLTHLCLKNSEIHMGTEFDDHEAVQELIHDKRYSPMLLYPGKDSVTVSETAVSNRYVHDLQLLVILLDGTWRAARKMFNRSRTLQRLPRLGIVSEEKSRYRIKKQPHDWCLSTIEATHELLVALDKAGLDSYAQPGQMLELFARMQQYQISCRATHGGGSAGG